MPTAKRERKKAGRQARQEQLRAQHRRAQRRRRTVAAVVVAAAVVVLAAVFSRGGDGEDERVASEGTTTTAAGEETQEKPGSTPCPPPAGSPERKTAFDGPPPTCVDRARAYTAKVTTDVGAFTISLDAQKAPKTVNNFVFLARYRFYDGVPFHRVIPGFVVQGGDGQKGDGTGGPGYTIADELPQKGEYQVGSLAMANTGQPNSGGSQFFVVTGPQGVALPPSYTLFGKVTEGLDVVKKIEADGTESGTPKVVHRITQVSIVES